MTTGPGQAADVVYSRQWRRDGFPIAFETNDDYVLSVNDTGAMLDCVVYARGSGGLSFIYAAPVGPVEGRALNGHRRSLTAFLVAGPPGSRRARDRGCGRGFWPGLQASVVLAGAQIAVGVEGGS